ncbi:hypothetical protein [Chromobacterium sp. ASV23]|uniref:hypothetical protein n=1 Tax=Chromobacterium sp. ASV23 TaxID=2795110 RepID=UPI0018EB019E|nr:hypothetical protein [Chromobacterium sp. ASV23]
MMRHERPLIRLRKEEGKNSYGELTGTLYFEVVEERSPGEFSIPSFLYDHPKSRFFNWLTGKAWVWKGIQGDGPIVSYDQLSYETRWMTGRLDADRAERMFKTLSWIDRQIDKAQDKTSLSCSTPFSYLMNLAEALNVKGFVIDGEVVPTGLAALRIQQMLNELSAYVCAGQADAA